MAWPWNELAIEPTTERRAIKRAYAKLLKSARPDEQPEEFKALHAAYTAALELAENPGLLDSHPDAAAQDAPDDETPRDAHELTAEECAYAQFMQDLEDILALETPFADMDSWDRLLESPCLDDLDTLRRASFGTFAQLCEFGWNNRPRLRKRGKFTTVLNKFDERFAWSDQELELTHAFGEQPAENLLKRLAPERPQTPLTPERLAQAAGEGAAKRYKVESQAEGQGEGKFHFWILVFFIGMSIIGRLFG